MDNSHRVAIITGASQGIGESLMTAYRKLGYAVVAGGDKKRAATQLGISRTTLPTYLRHRHQRRGQI